MASGLVCGFSCVVIISSFRQPAIQLERSEMWVFDATPFNNAYLWD